MTHTVTHTGNERTETMEQTGCGSILLRKAIHLLQFARTFQVLAFFLAYFVASHSHFISQSSCRSIHAISSFTMRSCSLSVNSRPTGT